MTPLAAALSSRFMARRRASALSSVPAELSAVLTRVFSSLLTALLRSARLALVRIRFFWLLMLATDQSFVSARSRTLYVAPEQPENATETATRSHRTGRSPSEA